MLVTIGKMGKKKKILKDPEPYLFQLQPLSADQLCIILDNEGHKLANDIVSQVSTPRSGQVFLVRCAGSRFARYDTHRWMAFHRHDGLQALLPPGAEESLEDLIEVRYNKKCGRHENLGEGAIRIVYRFKSENTDGTLRGDLRLNTNVSFHVVQYLEKLPDYVLNKINLVKEAEEAQVKEHMEKIKREKQAELEAEHPGVTSSLFGRRRKPNSRYQNLYQVEFGSKPLNSKDDKLEEEWFDDVHDKSYDNKGLINPGTSGFREVQHRLNKRRSRGSKCGNRIWMAGYCSEKMKPKSSSLFSMCKDNVDDGTEMTKNMQKFDAYVSSIKKERSACHYGNDGTKKQAICYSEETPIPALIVARVMTIPEINYLNDVVFLGKTCVYSTSVLLPKEGELFVRPGDMCEEDESWNLEMRYPQQTSNISVSWYNRTEAFQPLSDFEHKYPNVMLVYRISDDSQFCFAHYLCDDAHGVRKPLILPEEIPSDSVFTFHPVDPSDDRPFREIKCPEHELCNDQDELMTFSESTLNSTTEEETTGNELEEGEEQECGRKQNYKDDEPKPCRIYTKGKLTHTEYHDIFNKALRGEIPIIKTEIKQPQYGDVYVLDKDCVPFSDSLPWVRDYYYKSPAVVIERFSLRDANQVFTYPLPPSRKAVFTHWSEPPLCVVHYEKGQPGRRNAVYKYVKNTKSSHEPGTYTESTINLSLSLVAAMLENPDEKRIVSAPILDPQPFQVYLVRLPPGKSSKVIDNYNWTDKGIKYWPLGVSNAETRLICYHSPMKMPRNAMCTALMKHEFKHTMASPNLRVVHYMPTREFREFIVISNAAKQMQAATELSREDWEEMELESESPLYVSSTRLKPSVVWDLLTRDSQHTSLGGIVRMEIIAPQPGGVYLSTKYDAPDLLFWEEVGKLQVQPKLYQILEICDRVSSLHSFLVRLRYTSPKVPHRILVHYLGDPRTYISKECEIVIDENTREPSYVSKDTWRRNEEQPLTPLEFSLKEEELYKIYSVHMREVGCMPLKIEDLDIEVVADIHNHVDNQEKLISPDKPGLYLYGQRMLLKRIIRILENLDRSQKTQLPINNPEAGEAYLVSKPLYNKAVIDQYKWMQKGWQPMPRKDPVAVWRWNLLRHKKHTWAPPLVRIDYVHLKVNCDLMLVHYIPTKDNEMMLEIKSVITPVRTLTHTLLSVGDVNFGQHSQLLTNSALPPCHVWELLNAGGGLSDPINEPQPGAVYVINVSAKDNLDHFRWKILGDIRISSNDYSLKETSYVIDSESGDQFARLAYHTPLIKNRTVLHYLGDCRPYYEKAKADEEERQRKLSYIRKGTFSSLKESRTDSQVQQFTVQDISFRDGATEATVSVLGLGTDIMDSDTLTHTFAELGGEVEGLCEGRLKFLSTRPEDEHWRDINLAPINVPIGSVSTVNLVKRLFPQGVPKLNVLKILTTPSGEPIPKRAKYDNLVISSDLMDEPKEGDVPLQSPHRAIPRSVQDWNSQDEEENEESEGGITKPRWQITTAEPRTIVYIRQQETLTEKQIDHMLCNPDVNRISFVPLLDPQPGCVYVVAIPYKKGEMRRMDCFDWFLTGHRKGKYRRSYGYITEEDGNSSHRLLRYTYDYAWEDPPGLRVIHYIPGDPQHQIQFVGKKPNYEMEPAGSGPLYCAYTASMTHRDALQIINDPPLSKVCDLPIQDPKAGEVYLVRAPSLAFGRREMMYDNLTWSEGHVKHIGGKRPVVRKMKYVSFDPVDGTRSNAFSRITWERLVDVTNLDSDIPISRKKQAYVIIHYLGDETVAGEMVRQGKDGSLHLRQIRHYLETGAYLPSVHLTEKNGIRKSSRKFTLEGNVMYYTGKTGTEKRKVLFTNDEKNKAFEECHIMHKFGDGEHCGRTKTMRRLAEKYYWTSMIEDIVAMIVRCKTCEFNKWNRPVHRYVRVTEPWEVVTVDIIGQFVASDGGHMFVAIIIDMFTKYTIAVPLRDTTVSDLAAALRTAVFQQGPPRKFLSDQYEEFVKELNQALECDVGLVNSVISVSKAQINRPDEASIKTAVLHHCLKSGSNWDSLLQKKIYELNTNYITSSGETPFYLMFYRKVRPLDSVYSLQVHGSNKPSFIVRDIERYMEERERNANDIIQQVMTGKPGHFENKPYTEPDEVTGAESITSATLLNSVADESGDYAAAVPVMADTAGPDEDHAHYTHMAHLAEGQVLQDSGGSVYEMGDGEGHVVVVADGMPALEEEGDEVAAQHMVVVQPGVGDQGVIMLSQNPVIMETVDGQQFTYMSDT